LQFLWVHGLEVRFYGAYKDNGHFDAALLRHLPSVRNLTLNCLRNVVSIETMSALPALEVLQFGAFDQQDGSFVATLPLEQLTRLGVEENKRRNFDLAPLARCGRLERLFIGGHTRGLGAISGLPKVRDLQFSGMPKTCLLDPINLMPALKSLRILLGSRESIDELAHPTLEKLTIDWVRGLQTLGNLARFPSLRELIVEDQLHVTEVDVSNLPLTGLRISNCKSLSSLIGLDSLNDIEWFQTGRTKLDLERLRDFSWPSTIKSVGLFSGSRRWNDATRDFLAAKGITQFPEKVVS